jgi:hypothetical protein
MCFFWFQRVINREKQRSARTKLSRLKILHECRLLRERLQECSAKFLAEEQDNFTIDPSSLPDALDLLATSDNRIRLLVAEVNLKCKLISFFSNGPAWPKSSYYILREQPMLRGSGTVPTQNFGDFLYSFPFFNKILQWGLPCCISCSKNK